MRSLAVRPARCLRRVVAAPLDDYLAALQACLRDGQARNLVLAGGAFVVSWWIYVPVHELGHALGCLLAGGEVTRLEIAPIYGAALLQTVFPFVAVGSDYAGQLTGFDTHGSDLTYLATDLLPFVLTVLVGIPLLRSVRTDAARPRRAAAKLGASLPIAYAPFISVTGDYYEMGSILVSRAWAVWCPSFAVERWRSDDLLKLVGERLAQDGGLGDLGGIAASFLVGLVLIFVTYWVGIVWARVVLDPGKG